MSVLRSSIVFNMAEAAAATEIAWGLRVAHNTLRDIRFRNSRHRGKTRNVSEPVQLDQDDHSVDISVTMYNSDIESLNVEQFIANIIELGLQQNAALAKALYSTMSETADAVGNSIDKHGSALEPQDIIEMFRRIEFDFEDDGTPIFPEVHLSPQVADIFRAMIGQIESDPALRSEMDAMIVEKRRARLAKTRHRRLPRPRD